MAMAITESTLDKLKKAKDAAATLKNKRPAPKSHSMEEEEVLPPKVCVYGPTGTGKTFFLKGPVLAGERLYVVSSDFGSNGLITLKLELKRLGRTDLYKNIRFIDLNQYEQFEQFFADPASMVPEFWDFDPTVLVWEGFSNFNANILDEYILSFDPSAAGAGDLRKAGFTHTTQDWQGMQRGTMRPLGKFMALQNENGTMGKILTCHDKDKPEFNESTKKTEVTVLVQGGARKHMPGAFDVIMVTFSEDTKDGLKYFYRCKGDSSKFVTKSRGYDLRPIEPADPEHVWKVIKGTGGQKDTKELKNV